MNAQKTKDNLNLFFDHITKINGLSGNQVNCIYRDHRGFLWIGTQNGLNQYDGRNITVYKHSRFDNSSIVNNKILNITEDDSGYLWLGTIKGISKFNPYNHTSVNYTHDDNNPYSLNENYKCHIFFDKNKSCWIGNEAGLSYFDRKTNHFIPQQILPDSLNKKPHNAISSFLEDKQGRFWLGTYSGLVLYDRKTHKAQTFVPRKEKKTDGSNAITSLFCDHAGRIWVGTWGNGITEFDPATKNFYAYTWNKTNHFAGTANIVTCINETQSETGQYILWVGTTEGMMQINGLPLSDKTVAHILPDISMPNTLNSANVSSMLSDDNRNILWIGTDNGINQYSSRNQLFSNSFYLKGNPTKIISDTINNKVQYFVTAWYGNALTQLDSNFKQRRIWKKIPEDATNPDNRQASDMVKSKDGTFWIATFNGLYHFDIKANHITSYLHQSANINTLSDDKTTAVAEDKNGNLWIGTYGRGLDKFDPVTKSFTHFVHDKSDATSLIDNLIWGIFIDRRQKIWVVTDHGISIYDETTRHFLNYADNEKDPNSLKGNSINGMLEDRNGIYWITTDKGLNRFDMQKNQFRIYGTEEGLNDDNINSITEDKQGILWMCTPDGISSFNPVTKNFINYDEQNGLPKGINGSITTLDNGSILAGGDGFILKFNPSEFKIFSSAPPIYITQMSVAGSPLSFQKPLEQSGTIVLEYPQNSFSCTFTAPNFFNSHSVKYAYRLTGVDEDWVQSGNRNFLSYANLAAGTYVLHIKAANGDGVWNEKGIELKIAVLPPFWKTWWFLSLLFCSFIVFFYALYRHRLNQVLQIEKLRNKISLDLHDDIGSTLSSISILSEIALHQKTESDTKETLKEIKDNSISLMERMDDIVWSINPKNDSLESLFLRMKIFAAKLFEAKGIDYKINIDENIKQIPVGIEYRRHIYLIMKEAINNLVKYSNCTKATIAVSYHTSILTVAIEDNGNGYDLNKITFGNGLHSMKKRAEAMKGEIHTTSGINNGTSVKLRVKIK